VVRVELRERGASRVKVAALGVCVCWRRVTFACGGGGSGRGQQSAGSRARGRVRGCVCVCVCESGVREPEAPSPLRSGLSVWGCKKRARASGGRPCTRRSAGHGRPRRQRESIQRLAPGVTGAPTASVGPAPAPASAAAPAMAAAAKADVVPLLEAAPAAATSAAVAATTAAPTASVGPATAPAPAAAPAMAAAASGTQVEPWLLEEQQQLQQQQQQQQQAQLSKEDDFLEAPVESVLAALLICPMTRDQLKELLGEMGETFQQQALRDTLLRKAMSGFVGRKLAGLSDARLREMGEVAGIELSGATDKAQIARAIIEDRLVEVKRVYSKYLNQDENLLSGSGAVGASSRGPVLAENDSQLGAGQGAPPHAPESKFWVGMCTGDGDHDKTTLGTRVRELLLDSVDCPDLWVVTEAGSCFGTIERFGKDDWKLLGVQEKSKTFGHRLSPPLKTTAVHGSRSEQPTQESPLRPVLHAVRATSSLTATTYNKDTIALLWNEARYDNITAERSTRAVLKQWNDLAKVEMVKLRDKHNGRELWLLGAHLTKSVHTGKRADWQTDQLAQLEALADILQEDAAAVILCADLNQNIKGAQRYEFNEQHKLAPRGTDKRYYYDGLPSFVPNIVPPVETAASGLIDNILHHKVSHLTRKDYRVRNMGVLNHNPIAVQFAWKS
jgi:hypothetical protein